MKISTIEFPLVVIITHLAIQEIVYRCMDWTDLNFPLKTVTMMQGNVSLCRLAVSNYYKIMIGPHLIWGSVLKF